MFKLIGPVLIKQDLKESQQNVNKRIEFINNEMYVDRARSFRTAKANLWAGPRSGRYAPKASAWTRPLRTWKHLSTSGAKRCAPAVAAPCSPVPAPRWNPLPRARPSPHPAPPHPPLVANCSHAPARECAHAFVFPFVGHAPRLCDCSSRSRRRLDGGEGSRPTCCSVHTGKKNRALQSTRQKTISMGCGRHAALVVFFAPPAGAGCGANSAGDAHVR